MAQNRGNGGARRAKRGRTRRIGALLAGAGGRAFARRGFRDAAVVTQWEAIAGPGFAARCLPESLRRDGTLTLRADGATALLLQHVEPQLRERIASYLGHAAVRRIAYRQEPLPPRAPAAGAAAAPAAEPPPEAAAALAALPDGPLRDALVRLGRRVASANAPPAPQTG